MTQLEPYLRLGVFFGVLLIMMLWEWWQPRRAEQKRRQRWPSNLLLVFLNTLVVRLVLPGITVGVALYVQQDHFGLFNWLDWPGMLEVLVAFVLLDMAIYWQHRIFHYLPAMWKIHRMHHSDVEYDVTTGARFHPIEILISVLIKVVVIALLGADFWAVVVFEIMLNATAMFNHSNIRLALSVDAQLRKVIVTPDMHRVHHSVYPQEHHQNFGFNLSVWDRLFDSYCAQPQDGHQAMRIGLSYFRDPDESRLDKMLTQPFRDEA